MSIKGFQIATDQSLVLSFIACSNRRLAALSYNIADFANVRATHSQVLIVVSLVLCLTGRLWASTRALSWVNFAWWWNAMQFQDALATLWGVDCYALTACSCKQESYLREVMSKKKLLWGGGLEPFKFSWVDKSPPDPPDSLGVFAQRLPPPSLKPPLA